MEYYDTTIIGAGIAGCGLAYNLRKFGYKGKILIIEKYTPGANAAYGYRNTFKKTIEEYNLPYIKKFKKLKMGEFSGIKLDVNLDFYLIDYSRICNHLIKNLEITFKREEVIFVKDRTLTTNKESYKFHYLIDASGFSFFLKKQLRMKLPEKYYIGNLKN
jgi:glycine/D-amino acid oxidase-like deaminating enzyme